MYTRPWTMCTGALFVQLSPIHWINKQQCHEGDRITRLSIKNNRRPNLSHDYRENHFRCFSLLSNIYFFFFDRIQSINLFYLNFLQIKLTFGMSLVHRNDRCIVYKWFKYRIECFLMIISGFFCSSVKKETREWTWQ